MAMNDENKGIIKGAAIILVAAGVGIGSYFLAKKTDKNYNGPAIINVYDNKGHVDIDSHNNSASTRPSSNTGTGKGNKDSGKRTPSGSIDDKATDGKNDQNNSNTGANPGSTMSMDEYIQRQHDLCDRTHKKPRFTKPVDGYAYTIDGRDYLFRGFAEDRGAYAFITLNSVGKADYAYFSLSALNNFNRSKLLTPLGAKNEQEFMDYALGRYRETQMYLNFNKPGPR
jgi:hypothetical protein